MTEWERLTQSLYNGATVRLARQQTSQWVHSSLCITVWSQQGWANITSQSQTSMDLTAALSFSQPCFLLFLHYLSVYLYTYMFSKSLPLSFLHSLTVFLSHSV